MANSERSFEILIVDDCPNILKALKRSMVRKGVVVRTVSSGQECIDLVLAKWKKHEVFDAIILDLHMPHLDGYSASSYLRLQHYPGLILSLTGDPSITDISESKEAGIDFFLTKPISAEEILSSIATCVLRSQQ